LNQVCRPEFRSDSGRLNLYNPSPWMRGGFIEVKNQENMYYHPEKDILCAVFVDDPLKDAPDEESHRWFHDFMDEEFDTNGENRLTPV